MDLNTVAREWREAVQVNIPGAYQQLDWFAKRRNRNTGLYRWKPLEEQIGKEAAQRVMLVSHRAAFEDWLQLSFGEQLREVDVYLGILTGQRRRLIEHWSLCRPYALAVPEGLSESKRAEFLLRFDDVMFALRRKAGV